MSNLTRTVDLGAGRAGLNGTLRGARNATMLRHLGNPRGNYDDTCRDPTNNRLLALMVTRDVGPFRVRGLRPAVETLGAILADVAQEQPEVSRALGSAGMLCCRFVRGSNSAISNHSWGTAIDLTLAGVLDRRGDGRAQEGLIAIHPIFNRHGFFWGAAFPTEDAMHFEASDQKIEEWAAAGLFGEAPRVTASVLDFGDRGPEVRELQQALNQVLGLDLDTDGVFGPATRAAVMEFQRDVGEPLDGIVRAKLLDKLRARIG
jgi:hypothetical protein